MVLSEFPVSASCIAGFLIIHMILHFVRTLFDPFQYESNYFLLVLHHALKQIQFFFTKFENRIEQFPSECAFGLRSGSCRLDAIPNWQSVLPQKMLLIAFRGEKYCMAIDTMTIGWHVMCLLDVLSSFRQILE